MSAHPAKLGLSRFLIDLIERGFITLPASNGAGIIHDFGLSLGRATPRLFTRTGRALLELGGKFGVGGCIESLLQNCEHFGDVAIHQSCRIEP